MDEPKPTADDLSQFHGGGGQYRHWLVGAYTKGVRYVAERGGAYWLIDACFSHQGNPLARQEAFQVWVLSRLTGNRFVLELTDGNSKRAIPRQDVEFSDFPPDGLVLYLVGGVLMLPTEY